MEPQQSLERDFSLLRWRVLDPTQYNDRCYCYCNITIEIHDREYILAEIYNQNCRTYPARTEYTSEKSAHALSELENVKKPTVMGTKYASKKVEVNRVYFWIFEMSK